MRNVITHAANEAWQWVRANPKQVLIAVGAAIVFNYVLYPLFTFSGSCLTVDLHGSSMGSLMCHIHNYTFTQHLFGL